VVGHADNTVFSGYLAGPVNQYLTGNLILALYFFDARQGVVDSDVDGQQLVAVNSMNCTLLFKTVMVPLQVSLAKFLKHSHSFQKHSTPRNMMVQHHTTKTL